MECWWFGPLGQTWGLEGPSWVYKGLQWLPIIPTSLLLKSSSNLWGSPSKPNSVSVVLSGIMCLCFKLSCTSLDFSPDYHMFLWCMWASLKAFHALFYLHQFGCTPSTWVGGHLARDRHPHLWELWNLGWATRSFESPNSENMGGCGSCAAPSQAYWGQDY